MMKAVAAGAIGFAIAAMIVVALVYGGTEASVPSSSGSSSPVTTMGYWQGKYDPIKPLPGTTNLPPNSFNNSVPKLHAPDSDQDDDNDDE